MRSRSSDLRIPRPDALPLSNRDSMVSEVYYEVLMTGIPLIRILFKGAMSISDIDLNAWKSQNDQPFKEDPIAKSPFLESGEIPTWAKLWNTAQLGRYRLTW